MDKQLIMKVLSEHKKAAEALGHKVIYMGLYGSQNYGLELNENGYVSDVDSRAIIMPTLDNLIENTKPVSTCIDVGDGKCEIKDIRVFIKTLFKANPAYIETMITEYYDSNNLSYIRDNMDELIDEMKFRMISAAYGMMCEKNKALTHPYPTIKHKIDKYGYDGKQAHHIYRLLLMIKKYYFNDYYMSKLLNDFTKEEYTELIKLKKNEYSLKEVESKCKKWMEEGLKYKNTIKSTPHVESYDIRNKIENYVRILVKESILNDLK